MSTPATYYLFVYGSLRSGFKSPVYEYVSRFYTFVGDGTVKGKLYDLGEYPAAIPTEDESYIVGELYNIKNSNDFSWAIGQLDDYEGVNVEADEVKLYRRDIATINCNGEIFSAWIYWYNGDVSGKPIIASGDIMEFLNKKK
jgi:gamma-glutamylcyclotransferase (GGCT)/AIG2-like uncharacterized protein YtfP